MRVDIERVRKLKAEIAEINRIPLDELEIYENGVRVEIPEPVLRDWKFVGLSNVALMEVEYWKEDEHARKIFGL